MANNNAIYNAVLSGAGGATQERWIFSTNSNSYDSFSALVTAVAVAVDSKIAPTTIDTGQRNLMQAIVQGIFSGRYPQSSSYENIANAIVALYTSLSADLQSESSGGGTSDNVTNESNVPGSNVTEALQSLEGQVFDLTNVSNDIDTTYKLGYVRISNVSPCEAVIQLNACEIGQYIIFEQGDSGQLSITSVEGVTINQPSLKTSSLVEQYSVAGLKCTDDNTYTLFGNLEDS